MKLRKLPKTCDSYNDRAKAYPFSLKEKKK